MGMRRMKSIGADDVLERVSEASRAGGLSCDLAAVIRLAVEAAYWEGALHAVDRIEGDTNIEPDYRLAIRGEIELRLRKIRRGIEKAARAAKAFTD